MFVVTTRRQVLSAAVALTATGALAACGSGSAPRGRDTRVIRHAMGSTPIPERPVRIVTLDDAFTSSALALGAEVVGYTTVSASDTRLPDYLGVDRKKYGGHAQWVGTLEEPNLEKIARLRPDLILSARVRHEQLYSQLSQLAPTVFSETTGATWKEDLRLTGRALRKQQPAERVLAGYQRRAKTVGDNIREAQQHNPTMSIVRFAGEPTVRLYTAHSFPGIVQSDTGLARPAGQPSGSGIAVNLSQERIPELDAEHIFVCVYQDDSADAAKSRSDFESNPLWDKLTGRQHEVSDTTWMTAVGPHGAHAILTDLARVFRVDPASVPV